jgi:2-oxo-4-hydroxy-4-carboxy-5-ureidoimidazoline decarboxylase
MTLHELHQQDKSTFVGSLGAIFEHSPWVAEQVWEQRPFSSVQTLHHAMVEAVQNTSQTWQLELIRAHPDLGTKMGARLEMSQHSVAEQSGAGLKDLPLELFQRFTELNHAYRQKFDFPFIIAVRDHNRQSILEQFELRLKNSPEQEKNTALEQIYRIAQFRLNDLIQPY